MKTEAMKRRDMTNTGTGPTFNPGESSVEVGVREEIGSKGEREGEREKTLLYKGCLRALFLVCSSSALSLFSNRKMKEFVVLSLHLYKILSLILLQKSSTN